MTKPNTRRGGLRKGDIARPKLVLEHALHSNEDREVLQLQLANVKMVNDCGVDAYVGIKYIGLSGTYSYTWPFIGDGKSITLKGVTDPAIFIYGVTAGTTSRTVWQSSTNNGHCFSAGDCMDKRNVGSLASGSVTYNICGDDESDSSLPAAASEWLDAHNSRRTRWYAKHGKGRADMKWSNGLKVSAQKYANKLIQLGGASQCVIEHGYQGDDYGGENLAANWGASKFSAEQVITTWYDDELGLPYGQNNHLTQVVFRSSRYVGCAVASKQLNDGSNCFIHVCRYVSPGNCNMFQSNWRQRTLDDEVMCTPKCPPDGCQ